jgi:N-acetylneuraminate synthase
MKKTYVIAEIGINHNGDFDLAKELIVMAKTHDCDAVKFQKRDIESVYTKEELDAPRESPWGTTNREQKMGLEFSIEQYKELELFSNDLGLDFIVSCWDMDSVDLIESNLNVKYHKVASALLTDKSFLEKLNQTGKPIIVSTGMSTEEEIDAALNILNNVDYILACTSTYPTKDEEINLNYITTLKQKYPNYKIGFSNHASGLIPCYGSVALGSECVEFHITKDRTMYGSDQAASIEHVGELVSGIRKMENILGDGIKVVYETEKPISKKLRKVNNVIL